MSIRKMEKRPFDNDIYRGITERYNPQNMRGILRINDTTESSFEHSIDEACKATNPHEAIREYARRKMKGTKYDSGYYRRDPSPESPLPDYDIQFTRINKTNDVIESPTPLSSLELSKHAANMSLNSTTPQSTPQTTPTTRRQKSSARTPKDVLKERQKANTDRLLQANGGLIDSPTSFRSPNAESTPVGNGRPTTHLRSAKNPTSTDRRNSVTDPVVSSSSEFPLNGANKAVHAVSKHIDRSGVHEPESTSNSDNNEEEDVNGITPPDPDPNMPNAVSSDTNAQAHQQNAGTQAEPTGNNSTHSTTTQIAQPPAWAAGRSLVKPLTPLNTNSIRTPTKQVSKIPVSVSGPSASKLSGITALPRTPLHTNKNLEENVVATVVAKSTPPLAQNQPVPAAVAPTNITVNLTINNSGARHEVNKASETTVGDKQPVETDKSDAPATQQENDGSLLTDDSDCSNHAQANSSLDETPKSSRSNSSSKRQLFVDEVDNATIGNETNRANYSNMSNVTLRRGQISVRQPEAINSDTFEVNRLSNRVQNATYDIARKSVASESNGSARISGINYSASTSKHTYNANPSSINQPELPSEALLDQLDDDNLGGLTDNGGIAESYNTMDADHEVALVTGRAPQQNDHIDSEASDEGTDEEPDAVDDVADELSDSGDEELMAVNLESHEWQPKVILIRLREPIQETAPTRPSNRRNKNSVPKISTLQSKVVNRIVNRESESFSHLAPPDQFRNDITIVEHDSPGQSKRFEETLKEIRRNYSQSTLPTKPPEKPKPRKRTSKISPELQKLTKLQEEVRNKPRPSEPGKRKLYAKGNSLLGGDLEIDAEPSTSNANANATTQNNKSSEQIDTASNQSAGDELQPLVENDSGFKVPDLPRRLKKNSQGTSSAPSTPNTSANSLDSSNGELVARVIVQRIDDPAPEIDLDDAADIGNALDDDELPEPSSTANKPAPKQKKATAAKGKKKQSKAKDGDAPPPTSTTTEQNNNETGAIEEPAVRRSGRNRNIDRGSTYLSNRQILLQQAQLLMMKGSGKTSKKPTPPTPPTRSSLPTPSTSTARASMVSVSSKPKSSRASAASSKKSSPKKSIKRKSTSAKETIAQPTESGTDEPPIKKPRKTKNGSNKTMAPDDRIALEEIDLENQDWYKNLININRVDATKNDADICYLNTSVEDQRIEITHIDKLVFMESNKVGFAFCPLNSGRGIMRFQPRAKKPESMNSRLVDFRFMRGVFRVTYGDVTCEMGAADLLQLHKDVEYSIESIVDYVGLIEFIYRSG